MKPYPLQWPVGYPRTENPQINGHFKSSFARARDNCLNQIRILGGTDPVISTDIPTRLDGLPYADAAKRTMKSQGVAVYFHFLGEQRVLCCDKWHSVDANMQAVALSIEAIRGLDRWGVSEMLKRVFSGFEALPERGTHREWWEVLEVSEASSEETVKAAWRNKTMQHHPDRGGNAEQFREVQEAWAQYENHG